MHANIVDIETMIAAQNAADWTFWVMIATWVAALASVIGGALTLVAVVIARRGLNAWKEQQISVAKADWIASLVNYSSGASHLPDLINWRDPDSKEYVDKIADLMYDCIKCWKVLQVHLRLDKELNQELMKIYQSKWENLSITLHNGYMEAKVQKEELRSHCFELYNL
ncbi:hypothetical protein FOT80_26670 [Serratia fonticola]|nr:hypothetical protein [Serratia fonticola]